MTDGGSSFLYLRLVFVLSVLHCADAIIPYKNPHSISPVSKPPSGKGTQRDKEVKKKSQRRNENEMKTNNQKKNATKGRKKSRVGPEKQESVSTVL